MAVEASLSGPQQGEGCLRLLRPHRPPAVLVVRAVWQSQRAATTGAREAAVEASAGAHAQLLPLRQAGTCSRCMHR